MVNRKNKNSVNNYASVSKFINPSSYTYDRLGFRIKSNCEAQNISFCMLGFILGESFLNKFTCTFKCNLSHVWKINKKINKKKTGVIVLF